ncbi:MAG: ubiquitin-conjugating enzyme E2, partial [archaeon]|nr:ubiquitin-conjugating enzyme E2 [archaeon]
AGIAQVAPLFAHRPRGPPSVPTMACRQHSHWEECRIGSFVLIKPPPDHFRDSLLSLDRDFRNYIGILAGIDTASQTLSVRYPSGLTSPLSPSLDIRVLEYTPESLPLAHFFLHSVAEATAAPTVAGHRNSYPLPHLVNTGTTSSNITHCNNRDASISSSISSSSTPPSTSTHHPNVADPIIMTELNLEAIHALPQMPESFLLLDTPVFELHHFITAPPSEQVSFLRHLRGEWKVLAELPPSIKLVSWSSRCDLLRAMIVGPPDSFYQDFLFFFDIHLPPTYPQDPPAVFFISRVSERVHPHLYAQGKVCLSLLGTWTAHSACERWIPYRSSLNQVLLSIQGLLLSTNKPYFLEPGFEKQCDTARGEALSHAYNERALVLLAQSTVRMLLHPDPIFQRPAYDHFQHALPTISRRLEDVLSNPDWSQGSKTPLQQINQHLKSLFVKLFP